MMQRQIIHVDMDEFFAAVEKLDDPRLAGKPLLIGGDPRGRGVVATASYEARVFGCHSAMPMSKALRLCPHAIVMPVRFQRYRQLSEQVFDILHQFTPLVEPLSIDEAFLDVSGCERLFGPAEAIARQIKDRIRSQTGLTASVGAAGNKFLAKIASDLRKPDGLVVITPENVHDMLDGLPVGKLWGVGPAAQKALARFNLLTIGQLRGASLEMLLKYFGDGAEHLKQLAAGIDERPVVCDSQARSIGQEETFPVDVGDMEALRGVLLEQVQQVARRLRRHGLKARTMTLKIRYGDFTTLTRSRTMPEPTDLTEELWQVAQSLLSEWAAKSFRPLRLLGATASGLSCGGQMSLFQQPAQQKLSRLDRAMDDITGRFGESAIRRGGKE